MITKEMTTLSTGIDDNAVTSIADTLNTLLADYFALYIKTKNFHWHVAGPHFREYHLLLDAQAQEVLATTDAIAERVRKLGGTTLRSIGDIGRRQTLSDDDRIYIPAARMLEALLDDNRRLVFALRKAKTVVDEASDNATSGILDTWTDEAEGRAWFLAESTDHNDS